MMVVQRLVYRVRKWLDDRIFFIGGRDNAYLVRWNLVKTRWFGVYLHKFLRDDDDRALHDHPWAFISIMLRGAYLEWIADGRVCARRAPSIAFRRPTHRHRVELLKRDGMPLPCWTLVLRGPVVRLWGFWCPHGFIPWRDFVDDVDSGTVGKGCN